MFAVDPTLEVIDEAIEWGAELLITHHPLLLKGVTSVAANTAKGKAVHRLIESGTALLTVHTNGDSAVGGVSDVLADALGLENVSPLTPAANGLPEEGIGRVGDLAEVDDPGRLRRAGLRHPARRWRAACGFPGTRTGWSAGSPFAAAPGTPSLTRSGPATPTCTSPRTSGTIRRPRPGRPPSMTGPYLIDVSHFASEWLWLPAAAEALGNVLGTRATTSKSGSAPPTAIRGTSF